MTRNRARGDDRPDIAAAYDAEHLAGDLDTHETVLFPFAGLGRQIGLGNLAGEREHQCDRMFGGGDRIAKRRIHHDNAFPGGGGNIDIIDAYSRAADHFQPLRPLEKFGGDLRRRANGKAVETADDAGELVLVLAEARLKIGLDAALLEDRDGGGRQGIGNQYARSQRGLSFQIGAEMPAPPGETTFARAVHAGTFAAPLLALAGIKRPWQDRPWFSRRRNRAKVLTLRYHFSRWSRHTKSEGRVAPCDRRRRQRPPFPVRANFRALSRKQPGPLAPAPRRPDRRP